MNIRALLQSTICTVILFLHMQSAGAIPLSDAQLFFDPDSIQDDFYARILLPDLSSDNRFIFSNGGDAILDADILPVLKPGTYQSGYIFSQNDYLQMPNIDYQADLTNGTLTTAFNAAGLYHLRVTRDSGISEIFAVFAEAALKEKTGSPNKTGTNVKLDPLPNADLFLVEQSDSALDDSAAIWENAGRTVQRVTSRQDVIDKIKAKSQQLGRKIHVELDGHGTSANISTGAGKNNISDKQIDLTSVADFQKQIDDFVDYITIQGCSVGEGVNGQLFLQMLADSIGRAGAWNQTVTVVDRSYFTVNRGAQFVEVRAVPEPPTIVLFILAIPLYAFAWRATHKQRGHAQTHNGVRSCNPHPA